VGCMEALSAPPSSRTLSMKEITLEANPGTVDFEKFSGFYQAGINRLSMGIQSFDDEKLRNKYPALQDAWEHYQNIKQMCETREKEEDAS